MSRSTRETAFWLLLLFLLHTDIAVPIGTYYLPSVTLVLLAFIMTPFAARSYKMPSLLFVIVGTATAALSVLFSSSMLGVALVRSVAQFAFALVFFTGLVDWAIAKVKPQPLIAALCIFLSAISVGAALEKYVPAVRTASDTFRQKAYGSMGDSGLGFAMYEGGQRDEQSYGGKRSSFFSPEPSIVATSGLVCGVALAVLAPSTPVVLLAFAGNALIFFGTRSPLCLIGLMSIVISLYWRTPRRALFISLLAAAGVGAASSWIDLDRLTDRWKSMKTSTPEMSIYSRIYVPYVIMTPAVMKHSPATGIGFGAKDVARRISPNTLGSFENNEFTIGTNGFARIFIYMGAVLGGIFLIVYIWHSARTAKAGLFGLFTIFMLGQCVGVVEAARYWGWLAIMLIAFQLYTQSVEEKQNPGDAA